ncbi:MAG: hypothetical protein KDD70_01340 [Bdellovibrionales bacterium]|nr:hypothetical protein [Bdellovibrionales bacterium]
MLRPDSDNRRVLTNSTATAAEDTTPFRGVRLALLDDPNSTVVTSNLDQLPEGRQESAKARRSFELEPSVTREEADQLLTTMLKKHYFRAWIGFRGAVLRNDDACLSALRNLSQKEGSEVVKVFQALNFSDELKRKEAIEFLVASYPEETLKSVHNLALRTDGEKRSFYLSAAKHVSTTIATHPNLCSGLNDGLKVEICHVLAASCPRELSESYEQFEIHDEPNRRSHLSIILNKDETAALDNYEQFAISDPSIHGELIARCAPTHPWKVFEALPKLGIEDDFLLSTLAIACAERDPTRVLAEYSSFGIGDPQETVRVGKALARIAPEQTAISFPKLGITDVDNAIEVAMACGEQDVQIARDNIARFNLPKEVELALRRRFALQELETDPFHVLAHIHELGEDLPQQSHFEILAACAAKNTEGLLQEYPHHVLHDKELRNELLMICANSDGKSTAKHFAAFELPESERGIRKQAAILCCLQNLPETVGRLVNFGLATDELGEVKSAIRERGVASNPWLLLDGLEFLGISNQKDRVQLAERLLESNAERFASSFDMLGIADADERKRLYRMVGERSIWSALQHAAKFELTDAEVQTEFANIAVKTNPHRLAESLNGLGVTDQHLLFEAVNAAVEKNAARAAREFSTYGLTDPELCKAIFGSIAEKNLWAAIEHADAFPLPDDDIQRGLVERGIRSNPIRVVQHIPGLQLKDGATIAKLAEAVVRKDLEVALALLPQAGILTEDQLIEMVAKAAKRDYRKTLQSLQGLQEVDTGTLDRLLLVSKAQNSPMRALEELAEAQVDHPRTVALVYREAIKKNQAKATRQLLKIEGLSLETRKAALIELAEKTITEAAAKHEEFGITANADKYDVIKVATRGDKWKAINAVHNFKIADPEIQAEVSLEALVDDAALTVKRVPTVLNMLSEQPELRTLAFRRALEENRVESAYTISESSGPKIERERTRKEKLELFDAELSALKARVEEESPIAKQVKLLEGIRKANCAPQQTLADAFAQFDDEGDTFLFSLLNEAGETFGGTIVSELPSIYRGKSHIPVEDYPVIKLFIEKGFRGFNAGTFAEVQEAYRHSPIRASRLLDQWKDVSAAILSGGTIPEAISKSGDFASFVYAAYRPVGMSENEVRTTLREVEDHTDHLAAYNYRKKGYELKLSEVSDIRVRKGAELEIAEIKDMAEMVITAAQSKPPEESEFQRMLVRAGQGAANQIDVALFVSYLAHNDPDGRIQEIASELTRLTAGPTTDKKAFEMVSNLHELFSSVVTEVGDLLAEEQIEGGRLEFGGKIVRRIAQELRKANPEELEARDIRLFVSSKLGQTTASQFSFVKKEMKKFVGDTSKASKGIRGYLAKNPASFFGRAGAGLCSATDFVSWNRKHYLQMNLVDTDNNRVVGNIQLHIFKDQNGKRAVLARPNPTAKFMQTVDTNVLAREIVKIVWEFADENDLVPYMPDPGLNVLLSNRSELIPALKTFFGKAVSNSVTCYREVRSGKQYPLKRIAA